MLQCLDDICNIEHYMVDADVGDTIQITLPKDIHYMDTHAEYTDAAGNIHMFQTFPSQVTGVVVATTCVMVMADSINIEFGGRPSFGPSFVVTVLKGIFVFGSELYARSRLIMTVVPTPIEQVIVNGVPIAWSEQIARNSIPILVNGIRVLGPEMVGEMQTVVRDYAYYARMFSQHDISRPIGIEYIHLISSWHIRKLHGCVTIFLSPGLYIGSNRLLEGTLFTTDEQGITTIAAAVKVYGDGVVGTVNQIQAGWDNIDPFSDEVKENAEKARQMAIDTVNNVKNGIVDGIKGAIFIGGLAVVGIVLVNQSKFNWAGIEDRPAKRMKK